MGEELYYNPATIREHAQRVKRAGGRQLVGVTLLGALIGLGAAVGIGLPVEGDPFVFKVLIAVAGGVAGFLVGDARAESMELAVRMALAQAARDEAR